MIRFISAFAAGVFCLSLFAAGQTVFPDRGAKDVCPDTHLRIEFSAPPTVGTGKITVTDASDQSVIASIDVTVPTQVQTIGGLPNFKYYPILIAENAATIVLPNHALEHGRSYDVHVDAGAFKDSPAIDWHFTTRHAPLPADRLIVSADGDGDFATVQGAIDSIPQGNKTRISVFIKSGTYNEIVTLMGRDNVTLLGEDRKKTIIAYANNDRFNSNSGGNPFATTQPTTVPATRPAGGAVYRRGMLLANRVHGLVVANLTLHNTTPHGGSQAESIIVNGDRNAHTILKDVDLDSFQDTLQINGQAYISDCNIRGDVDFMWGTGPCFFDNCHATSVRSNAYFTQIRNPPANHGYVFKDCTFDGDPGVTGMFLSRIEPTRFPASEVVLLNCTMTNAVGDAAWRLDRATEAPNVHFWEFNSHTPDGKPVDTSKRLSISKQLTDPADSQTITDFSDPSFVLGGWNPKTDPAMTALAK